MTSSFRVHKLTGLRFEADSLDHGILERGDSDEFEFTASVQPVSGNEKVSLPEGVREREMYRLYTDYALKTADETAKTTADRVTLFGKLFEVISVEIWQNKVIPHYKAIVSLIYA